MSAASSRLAGGFRRSFDVLRTDPAFEVKHVRDILSPEDHARLKALTVAKAGTPREKYEMLRFGRLIVHDAPLCTELQAKLTERIGELVGEPVEPVADPPQPSAAVA